jgi:hypothetical protein
MERDSVARRCVAVDGVGDVLGAEEKAEGAGHCKEEDYEEELDQAGLKLRRLTDPFGRGRFQKGLKVIGTDARRPSA